MDDERLIDALNGFTKAIRQLQADLQTLKQDFADLNRRVTAIEAQSKVQPQPPRPLGGTRRGGLNGMPSYRGEGTWMRKLGDIPCRVIQMRENQGNARVAMQRSDLPGPDANKDKLIRTWQGTADMGFRWEDAQEQEFSVRVPQPQILIGTDGGVEFA